MGWPFAFRPSDFSLGGVVEIIRMFHAASPASQRPGFSPTRGSGAGFVAETIGVTGFGIVDGGFGGGGSGGPPRSPRPPPGAFGASAGAGAGFPAGCVGGAFAGAAGGAGVAGAAGGG